MKYHAARYEIALLAMSNDIRARRKGLKLTQENLAERAGVSQPLVSAAERGQRILPEFAEKLEVALAAEAEKLKNSSVSSENTESAGHAERPSSNDVGMNAPRHLSAVHPAHTVNTLPSDVEESLGAAFRKASARVSDLKAVERIVGRVPTDGRDRADLEAFFVELLNAAARLRGLDEEITAEALLIELYAGKRAGA